MNKRSLKVIVIALAVMAAAALLVLPAHAFTNTLCANITPLTGHSIAGTQSVVGDVNNDGNINASDALLIVRYTMDLVSLSDTQLTAADCDGNSEVTMVDAIVLMRYCIGIPMPVSEPEAPTGPAIIVDDATAFAGGNVTVSVRIANNPGVAGAVLTLGCDDGLTLVGAASGEAFSCLQFTAPGRYANPCNFSWDSESGMATDDGTILTLTFSVSDSVSSGDSLNVFVSYTHGDIYDENLDDVDLDIVSGHIAIN